jgi:hypothetical protein
MAALKKSVNSTTTIPRPVTGNGSVSVSGRGLLRRAYDQRLNMAVDYKLGQLKLDPSLKNICEIFHVSQTDLREALKTHAALTNGNGGLEPLTAMAVELVGQLGLDGAFDLLVEVDDS